MKNFLMLILALIVVWILWGFVKALLGTLISTLITIGMILLFCFLVYNIYKALTREKLKY